MSPLDRRAFLLRAATLIPLMHAGGLMTGLSATVARCEPPAGTQPGQADLGRFARLKLHSHVLDETANFYRDTLGWPVKTVPATNAATAPTAKVIVTAGATTIEFLPAATVSKPYYHFAFNIPHNKLESAVDWMKPRAPLVKRANGEVIFHFPNWDAHAVYFTDPSGNIVEFIARHTLKNDAPGEFGVKDILYASEIGLVTRNVQGMSVALVRDLELFEYGAVSEMFAPIGDEHGLFIVVKHGRRWLASDLLAEFFPAEVVVRGKHPIKEALTFEREQFGVTAYADEKPTTIK